MWFKSKRALEMVVVGACSMHIGQCRSLPKARRGPSFWTSLEHMPWSIVQAGIFYIVGDAPMLLRNTIWRTQNSFFVKHNKCRAFHNRPVIMARTYNVCNMHCLANLKYAN